MELSGHPRGHGGEHSQSFQDSPQGFQSAIAKILTLTLVPNLRIFAMAGRPPKCRPPNSRQSVLTIY